MESFTNSQEINHGYQEHIAVDGVCNTPADTDRANEEAYFRSDQAFDFSEFSEDLDFSDIFLEEGLFSPLDNAEASFDAALNDLKKSKGRGLTKKQAQTSFSEDDFDDVAQRKAFILLRHYKNNIFKAKSKSEEIIEAVNFIFGRSESGQLNFDLCCDVLEARRDVLRLRFHYEFFLKWMVFPFEFPFMIDPMPQVIENEILMHVNENSRALAVQAWRQPGICTADLFSKARQIIEFESPSVASQISNQDMKRWLEALEDRRIMSISGDNWYLTGRNPLLDKISSIRTPSGSTGKNVSWSKLW